MRSILASFLALLLSVSGVFGARKESNAFSSSVQNVQLIEYGTSESDRARSIREVLKGKEKWLDEFFLQVPSSVSGTFRYQGKVCSIGLSYGTTSAETRAIADKLSIRAAELGSVGEVGIYPQVLKVTTANGFIVFAVMRTPVTGGFNEADFGSGTNEVDDLFK